MSGSYRLYKRPESPFIWIEFRLPGRSKIRRSSGTTDEAEARRQAEELLGQAGGVSFKAAAVALFDYGDLRPASIKRYRTSIRQLHPFFGEMDVNQISRDDLKRFVRERKAQGRSDMTVRRDLACLSSAITTAMNYLEGAPEFNVVTNFSKRHLKESPRERFLTRGEVDHLKEMTTKTIHAQMIELAVQTGMRKSELLGLTWKKIDLDQREITLKGSETKNGQARIIPLTKAAVSLVSQIEKSPRTQHVFWIRDWEGDQRRMVEIKRWWEGSVRRSELEDLRFHDLRHTFASWWCQRNGNLMALKSILGHSTMAMVNRYSHLATQHLHEAVRDMEDV